MHVSTFIDHLSNCDRNRALMSRILLNNLGHAERYPVDISELRFLSATNRAITNAFEEWAHSQPGFVMAGASLPVLKSWAGVKNPYDPCQNFLKD